MRLILTSLGLLSGCSAPDGHTASVTTASVTTVSDTGSDTTGSDTGSDTTGSDTGSDTTTGGKGADWVGQEDDISEFWTTSAIHAYDRDDDGYYGTAGWVLFAVGDASRAAAAEMVPAKPLVYSSSHYQTILDLPTYITLTEAGQDFIAAGFDYPLIDDPREVPAAAVDDVESGLAVNNYVRMGREASVKLLKIGTAPPATIRIGVMLLGTGEGAMASVHLVQRFGGNANAAATITDGATTLFEFFDLHGPVEGDIYQILMTKTTTGVNPNVAYLGLTFD